MTDGSESMRINSWSELFMRTVELGLGAAALTADAAQRLVGELVKQGKVAREESSEMVNRLLNAGREQREMLSETVEKATERTMRRMDVARRTDLESLQLRVANLEQAVLGRVTTEEPITPQRPESQEDFLVDQE